MTTMAQDIIDNLQHAAKQAAGDQAEHVKLGAAVAMGNDWCFTYARVHGVAVATVFFNVETEQVRIEREDDKVLEIAFANAGVNY
jgi:hypothetical protein